MAAKAGTPLSGHELQGETARQHSKRGWVLNVCFGIRLLCWLSFGKKQNYGADQEPHMFMDESETVAV